MLLVVHCYCSLCGHCGLSCGDLGGPPVKGRLHEAQALIIVDVQNDFITGCSDNFGKVSESEGSSDRSHLQVDSLDVGSF